MWGHYLTWVELWGEEEEGGVLLEEVDGLVVALMLALALIPLTPGRRRRCDVM